MNPLTWYSAPAKVITIYNRINGDRIATVHKEEAIPLIAAAPDLLEACEEAFSALLSLKQSGDHKDWEAFEPLHKAFKMTEAAIKQAKG